MHDPRKPNKVTRRDALGAVLGGAAGLAALGHPALRALAAPQARTARPAPRARSVIQLWMWGGPCHVDTFDPKPRAGQDYTGPLASPIPTNVDDVFIGELLPELAKQADKFAILRSVTHGVNAHETAAYITQTGRFPSDDRLVYPSIGAVTSLFKGPEHGGYTGRIPPHVVLTRPLGRFAPEGFLGVRHKPFVTGGDPRQARFAVEGIVAEGVTDERQRARRKLLGDLDGLGRAMPDEPSFAKFDAAEEKAYELILGDAGKVFDLGDEPDAVKERYGRTTFGQSCLVARRLVEQGVPYVTINSPGWDTHKRHFEAMRQRLPELDRGMSALLQDLSDRGLLDQTIVWWGGEFGRTPKVQWEEPWNGGRSHFGACFSMVVAGGGIQGGRVLGASDDRGQTVAERPVTPEEIHATIYTLLGIDPDAKLPNDRGLDVTVLPATADGKPRRLLREILA